MKVLKYIIVVVLVLILIFFSIGLIKPTVSYGHTIKVNKPISEAWAIHQDESTYSEWLKGFKSIDLISGEAGKVGSKYKVVVRPAPDQSDFVMIETITSIKENDHVSSSFDSDMMVFDQTTSFSEQSGITTIKTDSKVHGKRMAMKSMFALMELVGGSFQSQEVENIENLKKVIESSNYTNY